MISYQGEKISQRFKQGREGGVSPKFLSLTWGREKENKKKSRYH